MGDRTGSLARRRQKLRGRLRVTAKVTGSEEMAENRWLAPMRLNTGRLAPHRYSHRVACATPLELPGRLRVIVKVAGRLARLGLCWGREALVEGAPGGYAVASHYPKILGYRSLGILYISCSAYQLANRLDMLAEICCTRTPQPLGPTKNGRKGKDRYHRRYRPMDGQHIQWPDGQHFKPPLNL